jgi:uncharacterized protein YdaU (DUF1376 family)
MTEIIYRELTEEEEAERKAWEQGEHDRAIEAVKAQRQSAYQAEADPIFFQAQREAGFKMEDWHAKIAEIEERYPYPSKED